MSLSTTSSSGGALADSKRLSGVVTKPNVKMTKKKA